MVVEREIFAILVEFKHHSMAETIRKVNDKNKLKVKAPVKEKKLVLRHLEWFEVATDVTN